MQYLKKILFFFFFLVPTFANSQILDSIKNDSVNLKIDTTSIDSIKKQHYIIDTVDLINDTIPNKTTNIPQKGSDIKDPINFEAEDSMHISINNRDITLYGQGHIKSMEMDLTADSIGIDLKKKEIYAQGLRDSTGKIPTNPIFKTDDKDYTADRMRYNFESKRGLVYNVITKESDGFLHGEIVKIQSNDEMDILNGKYTTCDLPHPHYYIDLTKAKLKKNDKIISGPIYFVIEDIPLKMIAAPFGIFPLSRKNSSGIHFPTYADRLDIGLGLEGFGYYWAINDYVDLDVKGKAYSKGSWGVDIISNSKIRYIYSSKINFKFFHTQTGERDIATTKIDNKFSLNFNFNQDPKFWPYSNISANINFVKGNIQQYEAKNIDDFVNTTTSSTINFQKTFQGTPFRLNMNMGLNQNLKDSTMFINLPTLNFSMKKIFPFKPVNKPARGRWYEKIGLSFTSSATNTLDTHDTTLYHHTNQAFQQMKSGIKYDIPFQTNMTVLRYFNLSPSFNLHGRIYPYKFVKQRYTDADTSYLYTDTIRGFNHVFNYDFSASFNTRIYGMFNLNIGKLKAIRHTITPTLSYRYTPNFADPKWGYFGTDPDDSTKTYSYYQGTVYGSPSSGEQQSMGISIGNNFEAKVLSGKGKDVETKKIKLIDNLNFSTSYNFAADSLNLSPISINASTSPIKNTRISMNANFDPYVIDDFGRRINKFELIENKKLARITNANISLSTSLSSKEINKMLNKIDNPNAFSWSANLNYTFRYSKTQIAGGDFNINLTQNIGTTISLAPTPLWGLRIRTGYDLDNKQITSTTLNITRDLHCWQMSLQVTPFGKMKSYFFQINIKSSMFSAIKFKRERSWHDNF